MLNRTKLDRWCDAVLEAGWLAALIVAPLFFNVFSSRVFEPDKISLVRTIALTMSVAWLIKVANGGFVWLPAYDATGDAPETKGPNWRGWLRNPFFIPVTLLVVAYLLSTLFSVAGFVSWFGSYQRLQGTYSFLAYVTIGGLTAATLRRPVQIRRLQHAVIVTSLACSIYGVVQHYNIDPLPWGGDVTTRVAGNAGNAIFLAAYLVMAFFLTLERVFSSFVRLLGIGQPADAERQDWQTSLAGGAYLFVLLVQAVAILWTQSRGPWLGWFLGIYLFALVIFSTVRPRFYRAFTAAIIGLAVAGVVFLVTANTVPAMEPLRGLPFVGRLASVLELETGTGLVRALIWSGAAEMVKPHESLTFPDGRQDAVNLLRPLVGYGPEAMWVAFNRFYPPDLAHIEARNASPDRSHNETWDSLVVTGILGFVAYMTVFISIIYWALRWLGLIVRRRDTILFGILLAIGAIGSVGGFYFFDNQQLRLFGVALPFGLMGGFAVYISIAAFLHGSTRPDRADLPRQVLIVALLAAIVAHYLEIHFGISIGATRTNFWVLAATLMVVGMRLAQVQPLAIVDAAPANEPEVLTSTAPATPATNKGSRSSRARAQAAAAKTQPQPRRVRRPINPIPMLPATVLTDVLVFLTFVYIYTTNAAGTQNAFDILFGSIFQRPANGQVVNSPAIFFLLFFTWLVAATIGLAAESMSHARAPGVGWWARGYGLHAAVVWGSWLVYGVIQAQRLAPMSAPAGTTNQQFLNMQLERVGGHFGFYTFIVVCWILIAGTLYAWPWLRERGVPAARRAVPAAITGVAAAALAIFLVYTVNVNLVKADIVYKQGQQFDSQGNWLNSVELYKRALATRKTEDHYMLFLGRALLEQAKQAPVDGTFPFAVAPTLDDVLNLTPDQVAQMSQTDLLRAAEVVLLDAQTVNPLNTDHTANLARLYRTWADLAAADPVKRADMLTKSVATYDTAVMLSPNAAHLWNERGNALSAEGKNDEALASFEKSLSIDQIFDQTYMLMGDLLQRTGQTDKLKEFLNQSIDFFTARGNPNTTAQLLSFLNVVLANQGDLEGAAAANLKTLELLPNNPAAMRNLAIIRRDQGNLDEALDWANKALAATDPGAVADLKTIHQLLGELYQRQGRTDLLIDQYEQIRQLDPADATALQTLSSLYGSVQNDPELVEVNQALAQIEPQNYVYPLVIAQALQRLGRTPEGLPYAQQALTLAPEEQKAAVQALVQQLGGQ